MTRDELEDRVADLEARVEELESVLKHLDIDDSDGDVGLADIMIGGNPIGVLLQQALEQSKEANERIDDFNEDAGTIPTAVREQMLPAHEMALDIRRGRTERIDGKSTQRAAELFGRILEKVSEDGDPQPGIDNSGGTVTIQSPDAQEMILAFDDSLDRATSETAKRVFRELQTLTKRVDCECDSIDACEHGLVVFKPGATNKVVSSTDDLIGYGTRVDEFAAERTAEAVEEDGGEPADDGEHAPEAPTDTSDPFDELADAEPARANGTANVVVSSDGGEDVSSSRDGRGGDTTR
jgi:hypothetical protein